MMVTIVGNNMRTALEQVPKWESYKYDLLLANNFKINREPMKTQQIFSGQ